MLRSDVRLLPEAALALSGPHRRPNIANDSHSCAITVRKASIDPELHHRGILSVRVITLRANDCLTVNGCLARIQCVGKGSHERERDDGSSPCFLTWLSCGTSIRQHNVTLGRNKETGP